MSFFIRITYKQWVKGLVFVLLFQIQGLAHASETNIKLEIPKPKFVLPPFTGEYMKRDSTIAPHESELSKELRDILENKDKTLAVEKLNAFFELELSPAMLHLKGQVYFTLEQYDEAERVFKVALMRMPEFVRAHGDLAKVYLVKNDYKNARLHLAKAVSLGEQSPEVYGQLGFLNMELHSAHSAISMYQNALALDPTNFQWQQGLLASLSKAGFYDAATSLLDDMLRSNSENIDLWLNKAFIHSRQEQPLKALSSLETAIALGSDEASTYLSSAQLHLELKSNQRAVELFSKYMNKSEFEMATLYEVIQWLGQKQQWRDAQAMLKAFDKTSPKLSTAELSHYSVQKAYVAAGLKNYAQAKKLYEQALASDPTNVNAILAAANFYYTRKDYVEAEVLYTRAGSFESAEKKALLGRAQIHIELKDYESALNLMRIAYRTYPDLIELKDNIKILENTIQLQQL